MLYFIFVWKLLNSIRCIFFCCPPILRSLSLYALFVVWQNVENCWKTTNAKQMKKKTETTTTTATTKATPIATTSAATMLSGLSTVEFMPQWNKLFALFFAYEHCNSAMLMQAILQCYRHTKGDNAMAANTYTPAWNRVRSKTTNKKKWKLWSDRDGEEERGKINSAALFLLSNRIWPLVSIL